MMARGHFTHAHPFEEMKLFCGNTEFRSHALSFEINILAPRARRAMRALGSLLDLRTVASAAVRFFRFDTMQGGILAMAGQCFVCGNPVAPFGFGWPGFHRDKPKGKRGYLWTCSEHRPDGERRREAAIASYYGRGATTPDQPPTNPEKGPQE